MLPSGIVGSRHGVEFLGLKEGRIISQTHYWYSVTPSEASRQPITAVECGSSWEHAQRLCDSGRVRQRSSSSGRNNVARLNLTTFSTASIASSHSQPAMGWTDADQLICRLSIYCIKFSKDFFVNFEYGPPP
jgi:hypothetical protein